ncbi:MAG: hypothetical protein ACLPLZ_02820 [Terracidiphilus sp.]
MSQTFDQIASANSLQQPDISSDRFASAPQLNRTRDVARLIFRLDIRRSLQVHRRLAVSLAFVGLALAVIYLLNVWSVRSAQSVNNPSPALISETSAATHDLQPAVGVIPGFAKFAASAVIPWYSADSGVFRNAIVLLLSFIFLGTAVAVIAHKVDPRIHVASDIEHLLGFAPMAQLPDFSEVSDEVAQEHFLRLASGIDRAFKDRNLSHCVFTGTGPGVGVTTVAARVKEKLDGFRKSAVIAGASEMSRPAPRGGQQETALRGDDLSMLHQLIREVEGEAEGARREIILADSAPLTASEETEHLVCSADCAIVVIEAGVTTRAQLRAVANTLQRIKAPAVGFVLNRVRLATADAAFRRSIKEMNRHLRPQGQSNDGQMLQTLRLAIEEGSATLDLDAALPNRPAENSPPTIAIDAAPLELAARPDAPVATHQAARALPAPPQEPERSPDSVTEPADQMHQDQPHRDQAPSGSGSPWEETALRSYAMLEPETAHHPTSQASRNSESETGPAQESVQLAPGEASHLTLPRLSELRGMNFTQALRELDSAKHPAPPSDGIDVLMSAIAPFEALFTQGDSAPNDVPSAAADAEFDPLAAAPASFSAPEPGDAAGAENGPVDAENTPPQPSFLPFEPPLPEKIPDNRGEESGRIRPGRSGAGKPPGSFLDQLQILPSRRGQYKKKS